MPTVTLNGSLAEWLQFLGGRIARPDWIPNWPPDAFAVTAGYLKRTGAYVGLVNGAAPKSRRAAGSRPEAVGQKWRANFTRKRTQRAKSGRELCPPQVVEWWETLRAGAAANPLDQAPDAAMSVAAWNLCIASDVASEGIGISLEPEDEFLALAQKLLEERNEFRSFCFDVRPDKLAVLGKQHTPQVGCTIRSLSHHLALYSPAEIKAYWYGPYDSAHGDLDVFNMLLLPWPTEVKAGDFAATASRLRDREAEYGDPHRYFDFAPMQVESAEELAAKVESALQGAKSHADKIHAIVLPELSLTEDQYFAVEKVAIEHDAVLIASVREPGGPRRMPRNSCVIQPFGAVRRDPEVTPEAMRLTQLKHHRWRLDRQQVLRYDLGGRLSSEFDCWERIHIGERQLNFVTIGGWLTMCVLICEDLARQDPVAEVIRAVGPTLVCALLMDGPQLKSRWSSRYASVLAEDPGCSVLSLTSLGMALRSRPPAGERRSRKIALWRDAKEGEREIELEEGHDACVLSLVGRRDDEFTIDGRRDGNAFFPVYAGEYSFKVG